MASTNRKPSGTSSSRSANHSPLASPGNTHSHRNLTPAGHLFGVGMSSANTSKTSNSGWQAWGSTAPSTRNTAPSASESIQSAHLGLRDSTWNTGRGAATNWEESAQRMDPGTAVNLRGPRQRHTSTHGTTLDHSATAFPQSRISTSPTGHSFNATSPFSSQQSVLPPAGAYDSVSSVVEGDLSVAMRGMAVEHEHGLSQHPATTAPASSLSDSHASRQTSRPAPLTQPQRSPFPAFPQPDYSAYYNNPSAYPFDAYATSDPMYGSPAISTASPSLYPGIPAQAIQPHPPPDMRSPQSASFYDYGASGRVPSQYYYPPQPMMYHAPPPTATPAGNGHHKRRSMQAPYQTSPLMYSSPRSGTTARPQSYHAGTTPMTLHGHSMYPGMQMPSPHLGRGRRHEDLNAGFRSPLLEEFRNAKDRKWALKDIYGHVVEFSTDQHGSRFIQQKIETADEEEKQIIFDEIMPQNALKLIQDVFGNYVIQKFFEHGNELQKNLLAKAMEGHVLPLSLQMYGCRVVQKAIEHVSPEQQSVFVAELADNVLRCVKDANGNHVIQRLIESVPPERLTFVTSFQGYVCDLATHPYGCRVLQRCFENLPDHQTRALLMELQEHALQLMQDQFGNYVIQFVLEHGQPQDRAIIVCKLQGQMLHMSRHKFASNVVEKALVTAESSSRRALIDEIMALRPDGSSPVVSMMKDQFANYVLQRALTVADQDQKEALVDLVKPQLQNMRKFSHHGRHLVAIERLIQKCTPTATRERTPAPAETTGAPAATDSVITPSSPN